MSEPDSNIASTAKTDKNAPQSGPDLIAAYVRTLPDKPGVYRMFDINDSVLYVGKAKNLKKRVTAYTAYKRHPVRLKRMIRATVRMEFVITDSETEALLLEANLIKRLKPRYNILLRDDKSFPYILMRRDHPAAQLMKHRGGRKIKGDYYGPFASAGAVNRTVDTLQRAFQLRTCSDSIYDARTRPCMLHQIKRCSAPCTGEISLEDYQKLNDDATDFLSGKSEDLRKRLQKQMNTAAAAQDYELAAQLRDRLHALAYVSTGQSGFAPTTFSDGDVFSIYNTEGQTCIQAFFFRAGQNWGTRSFFPRHSKEDEPDNILDVFLAQFYADKPVPRLVLVNQDLPNAGLLMRALSEKMGRTVEIAFPQRGEKKTLIIKAQTNAQEALARRMSETENQARLLRAVQTAFNLPHTPERIEVYDNSHIQGSNAIGAFIVSGPEGFEKRSYRTFNIKDTETEPGDDYAMMREVMRRRFGKMVKADGSLSADAGPWPDLVVIDGGKGQLSAVTEVMDELGIRSRVNLVAIAKGPERNAGRETFHMNERRNAFTLPPRTPVLYYLQRLRDEAHRFAIGTHRARRKKQMNTNPLDAISGIGPKRKKALLQYFGSAKAVKSATIEDLANVEGVSAALAEKIHDQFQS